MRIIILLGVLVLMFWGCSQNEPDDTLTIESTKYFPLTINSYRDYQVYEVVFRAEGTIRDTFSYQLREEVSDTYIDDLGETIYLIDRSTRIADNQNWNYLNTAQAYISENLIVRVDDNIPFVKMELPVRQGQKWNGNQLFDPSGGQIIGETVIDYFKEWDYQVVSDEASLMIGAENYAGLLEISLANHENKVEIRKAQEWYAPNIGLAKKTLYIADTQCFDNCESTPWEVKGEKGHLYIQEIINYN